MAFNNVGTPVWCNANADISWWYSYGDNHGAQYAMANCQTPDSQMRTTFEGDQLNEDKSVTYFVGFHNEGPRACFHNLNGGGLS
ncbi:MAG TPA: hypothetical protein VMI52_04620 [Acetobacteraceae bacterium]|nr:hypothetical protein [Acetobacteraceae bacterium]